MTRSDSQIRLAGDVRTFAQNFLNLLSDQQPVERLLSQVVDDGLEMVFPERTLRSHFEFEDWYAVQRRSLSDQSNEIERIDAREEGDRIAAQVVVVSRATEVPDGRRIARRENQEWRLVRDSSDADRLRIERLRVVDSSDIDPSRR
jgi:hypothetical protein